MKKEGKERKKRGKCKKELADFSLRDLSIAAKKAVNKLALAIAERTK